MNSCLYFRKNSYYDASFEATNLVLEDETHIGICLNYENVNVCQHPLCIFNAKFPKLNVINASDHYRAVVA
jgi:hypothetical protein